jgi:hypothetical protein
MKLFLFSLFLPALSFASANTPSYFKLKTPRGEEISVTTHIPDSMYGKKAPVLIIAPGQSCNSKGPLFETLGLKGVEQDYAVVRYEWGYCNSNPKSPMPSEDLKNEIEDFQTVLKMVRDSEFYDQSRVTLAGKSLGSMVAYAVFAKENSTSLVLLTPVCSYSTDDNGKPLPTPVLVAEENYPGLKNISKKVFIIFGDSDSLCSPPFLFDYLKESKGNISVTMAPGDHGFRIFGADGKVNDSKTQTNLDVVVGNVFNWLKQRAN